MRSCPNRATSGARKRRADSGSPRSTTSLGARKYEIVSRDSTSMSVRRVGARQVGGHPRQEQLVGEADDPRHAIDGELRQRFAGLGGEHQGDVLIGAQQLGGGDDRAHDQVVEGRRVDDLALELAEELLQLVHPQRLEEHVLAAREQAVDRRSRHPAGVGDVVDGQSVESPPLGARLGGVEDPQLDGAHRRRLVSPRRSGVRSHVRL